MTVILEHGAYRVLRVEPEQVDLIRDAIVPLLERSIPYTSGFESADALLDTMREGMRPWQLWIVLDGASVCGAFFTSLQRVAGELVFQFEILAGTDAQAWIWPLVERFEQYMAFMYGCTHARIVGRKGWERFLDGHGYRPSHYITEKRLLPQVAELADFRPRAALG